MLAKVTLENFFSFGEKTEIVLHPKVNVLVGINGSGKSNFLKAIRLLYEGVAGRGFQNTFVNSWGGFEGVAYSSWKSPIKITYEFQKGNVAFSVFEDAYEFKNNVIYEIQIVSKEIKNNSYTLKEKIYCISKTGEESVFLDIENNRGSVLEKNLAPDSNGKYFVRYIKANGSGHNDTKTAFDSAELFLSQISDPERYEPLQALKEGIEQFSVFINFDTNLRGKVRALPFKRDDLKVMTDGSNVANVLMHIKSSHKNKEYTQIKSTLRKINPKFNDIEFMEFGGRLLMSLNEDGIDKPVSIEAISDGTLLFLILMAIFFNPHHDIGLLYLDEPETGLHPDMINSVAKILRTRKKPFQQVIIATHSPLLLNHFDLDEILIFEKSKENQTRVTYKSEEDFGDWQGEFLAGQMWIQGKLGGTRW